jgi:hypothetical protein
LACCVLRAVDDEKPSEPKVDGRPFDGGLGPTAQAAEGVLIGRSQLSAEQLHGSNDSPSWKAPAEKRGPSIATLIATIVLMTVVVLIALTVAGVI